MCCLLCVAILFCYAEPAFAQTDPGLAPVPPPATAPAVPPKPVFSGISVSIGSGKIVNLPHPVSSIFAADPNVVEVRPASPTSLFVFGKGVGATTIVATDSSGNTVAQYSVSVGPSTYAGSRLGAEAQTTAPGDSVSAETEPGGMIVRGTVQTPAQANTIINQAKIISPSGSAVVNDLSVREPIQVQLKVRIAYMSRSITRQLGINWSSVANTGFAVGKFMVSGTTGTGSPTISGTSPGTLGVEFPGGTFEGVIDALASDNLAHVLAEPTLTTLSGTEANFLAGGQFPIPISEQNGTISIEFKSYGVQLQFTPTVFSDGQISLQVSPILSQLSNANSVTISGGSTGTAIVVPGLTVQQASSTVILGSGQGMAIAGLLLDNSNQTDNAVPGLGEVPVLGGLFRGDSFARQQQELVITVTPYLVNPVNNPGQLALPDAGWAPPNDLQRILLLRDNGAQTASAAIPGDAGFVVQ
jgi:pilus assembly protein CpaC